MEVVAPCRQERECRDLVGRVLVNRFAIDDDIDDALPLGCPRVERVTRVVRQSELQIVAGRNLPAGRPLPLLFENLLELGAGHRHRIQIVGERQDSVGFRVGDHAVLVDVGIVAGRARIQQIAAKTTGIHDADVRARRLVGHGIAQSVGDEIAERRFARSVVTRVQDAVAIGIGVRGRDVCRHLCHRDAADRVGLIERRIDDRLDFGNSRVSGGQGGVVGRRPRNVFDRMGDDSVFGGVVGQCDVANVFAVTAGLDDRACCPCKAGNWAFPCVLLVRMPVENRVHAGIGVRHNVGEYACLGDLLFERRTVRRSRAGALVKGGKCHIGEISGLNFCGDAVDGLDGITEVETCDARGRHQGRRLLGDRTDHGNTHIADVEDVILIECGGGRSLFVDVRTEITEVGGIRHPSGEVVVTLVKFMIADRRRFEFEGVEDVDGRHVLLRGRCEKRCANVVARRDEQ